MQGLIDALLRRVPDTREAGLAEDRLEGEEDPQAIELRLLCFPVDLARGHSQPERLRGLQILADVDEDAGRKTLEPGLSRRDRLCLLLEGDVMMLLLVLTARLCCPLLGTARVAVDVDRLGELV